jgi:hypothetical protein
MLLTESCDKMRDCAPAILWFHYMHIPIDAELEVCSKVRTGMMPKPRATAEKVVNIHVHVDFWLPQPSELEGRICSDILGYLPLR